MAGNRKRADIVDRLASHNAAIRADAERELDALEPNDLDALYAMLQRNDRRVLLTLVVPLVAMAFAAVILAVVFPSFRDHPEWRGIARPLTFGGLAGLATSLAALTVWATRRRKAMGRAAEVGDVRSVPYLVLRQRVQGDAERLLADLLPKVQPTQAAATKSLVRGLDYRVLARAWNPDFVIAALQALARVGDQSVLGRIERFAAGRGRTGRDPRVREVARACAGELRARLEAEREHATLLRPASAPTDTLLRPASAPRDTDTARLLRPADPEGATVEQGQEAHAEAQQESK